MAQYTNYNPPENKVQLDIRCNSRANHAKSDRSHVVLWAKELSVIVVFLRPLGLRLLSHACPRLNKLIVNLRMAQYTNYNPPENKVQLDIRCNSRANHASKEVSQGASAFVSLKPTFLCWIMTNCESSCCKKRRMTRSGLSPIRFRRKCIELSSLWRVTENQGSILEREPERWLPHLRKAAGA